MAGNKSAKKKSFSEQLSNLVFGAKEASADNPNRGRSKGSKKGKKSKGKRKDQSIADFINFPGGKD